MADVGGFCWLLNVFSGGGVGARGLTRECESLALANVSNCFDCIDLDVDGQLAEGVSEGNVVFGVFVRWPVGDVTRARHTSPDWTRLEESGGVV